MRLQLTIVIGQADRGNGPGSKTRRLARLRAWLAASSAVAVMLAGGVAVASIPDAGTGVFHGCYSTKTGALRLINPAKRQKCAAGEKAVTWDQAGRRGPAGPTGPMLLPRQVTLGIGVPVVLSHGSYQFKGPAGVAFDGSHLWITNASGNSVTEVNASNGSLVRVLSGGSYGFTGPDAIAFDGSHLWIANNTGPSVTEVNASDGSLVQVLSGGGYRFSNPVEVVFDGSHLWIPSLLGNSVTVVQG